MASCYMAKCYMAKCYMAKCYMAKCYMAKCYMAIGEPYKFLMIKTGKLFEIAEIKSLWGDQFLDNNNTYKIFITFFWKFSKPSPVDKYPWNGYEHWVCLAEKYSIFVSSLRPVLALKHSSLCWIIHRWIVLSQHSIIITLTFGQKKDHQPKTKISTTFTQIIQFKVGIQNFNTS